MNSQCRLALFAVLLGTTATFAQDHGLKVKTTIRLTAASDGMDGKLELLEDARLTPKLEDTLWQSGGPDMALDPSDPLLKQLTAPPLQHALLRLTDGQQKVVGELALERELARTQIATLRAGYRTILVTTDLSAGFGSYSGPFTELLDLSHKKLDIATAVDTQSRKAEPIHLASTLKTAWRLSPVSGGPASQKDILELACRPNADASKFFITYTRYHWTGAAWVHRARKSPGMWEADEPFPQANRFPPA
jgi:hypothetical protein